MSLAEKSAVLPPGTASGTSSVWSDCFTVRRLVLLLGVLLFLQYPEVILGTHSFFYNDFGLFTYPVVYHLRQSLLHGEIPLWNALNDCGVPFLAQWNTSVCYPPTWLCIFLPLPWSLNLLCLSHLALAGCGMYLLAFRWTGDRFAASIAGLAFSLNGLTFNCLMWISNMGALGWMPLTILLVERAWREGGRLIISAAAVGAVQMLSGAPEIILITWLIIGTLWLGQAMSGLIPARAAGGRLGLVILIVAGISAVQLLPFFDLVRWSDRHPGEGTGAWAMPPWGLANFLVPLFRCARSISGPYFQLDQQWTTSFYCGTAILALALTAAWLTRRRFVWYLSGIALIGLMLALGDHFFLYPALKAVLPAIGFARYPIKFLTPTLFAIPLLAAFGVTRLTEESTRVGYSRFLLIAGCGLLVSIVLIGAFARLFPYREEVWLITVNNAISRGAFLVIILLLLLGISKTSTLRTRRWLGLLVLVLLGLDALTHVPRQNPTVSTRAFDKLEIGMSSVPRPGKSRAMVSRGMEAILRHAALADPVAYYVGSRRSLFEDCNLRENIPKVNGFFSLHLKYQSEVNAMMYEPSNSPVGLADFMGVTQISSATEFWKWDSRNSALPLATAGQQPVFAEEAQALQGLANPEFDARKIVYLPREAARDLGDISSGEAKVEVGTFRAHRIQLQTDAQKPALLVLSQSFYTAWRAAVDGAPAKIWRANHAFQALRIPAGKHQVSVYYSDNGFLWGCTLTGFTIVACLIGYWWMGKPEKTIVPK